MTPNPSSVPDDMTARLLDAALGYARRGWRVLPVWDLAGDGDCACPATSSTRTDNGRCLHPGKHPVGELVPRGVHDGTTDETVIRGWWSRGCRANVAVATGAGRIVLDIDPRNGGSDAHEALAQQLGALPETVTCATGGNGTHLYFTMPAGALRSSLGPGIDVKSDGGYVIAPPSTHVSGGSYLWRSEGGPDEVPLADLPIPWQAALQRPAHGDASAEPTPACDIPVDVRERRARAYIARMPVAVAGQGGHRALWAVACVAIRGMLLPYDRAIAVLRDYSQRCEPPWSERELRHKLVDATRARVPWGYLLTPLEFPPDDRSADSQPRRKTADERRSASGTPTGRALVRRMSDVAPEDLQWIWRHRLPGGKLSLLAGEPGVGKSTLAQAIAAAVSTGTALPDDEARPPADVVILSAEESPGDTIRPRLERMGADLSRIHILDGIADDHGVRPLALSSAADRAELESVVTERRAALIVIDVLQAYLGSGIDMHRANEIRAVLAPLKDLAERTGAAVLILAHTNKSASTSVTSRVLGSVDIVAAVRCVLIAGRDPDAPLPHSRGVVARGKSNLPGQPAAVGYELRDGILLWSGERSAVTAERLLAARPAQCDDDRPALAEAIAFLRQELADGERRAVQMQAKGGQMSISAKTLQRARMELGVICEKRGFGDGAYWVWIMPPEHQEDGQHAEGGHSDGATSFERPDHLRDAGAVDV